MPTQRLNATVYPDIISTTERAYITMLPVRRSNFNFSPDNTSPRLAYASSPV